MKRDEEFVRYYFELQRPMTRKELSEYWKLQVEQYRVTFSKNNKSSRINLDFIS